jgi:hypothetical protein
VGAYVCGLRCVRLADLHRHYLSFDETLGKKPVRWGWGRLKPKVDLGIAWCEAWRGAVSSIAFRVAGRKGMM